MQLRSKSEIHVRVRGTAKVLERLTEPESTSPVSFLRRPGKKHPDIVYLDSRDT